jgi:monoamine oxidase
MKVTILQSNPQDPETPPEAITKEYSHLITTTTMPCLGIMDLRNAALTYAHREAVRVLSYDSAVKIGIKFKYRWWAEDKGIKKSGVGMTDRPTRVVVYPSHALDTPPGESGVLIACYNCAQDASRLGGQLNSDNDNNIIFDIVMADLAAMHEYDEAKLRELVVSYHVHDWNRDPNVNGHFCMPGPGQFSSLFGHIRRPAAHGRLFIAGEGTSVFPGWIVGALNSSYRAVYQMLLSELLRYRDSKEGMIYVWGLIKRLEQNWGEGMEPEGEHDTDPCGTAGWEIFLGMCGEDV